MMRVKKLVRTLTIFSLCLFLPAITGYPVLAAEPHENPDTAVEEFSGSSLFRYYSDTLDNVILMDSAVVRDILNELPLSGIPLRLKAPAGSFADSSIKMVELLQAVHDDLQELRSLITQALLEPATGLSGQISDNISQAETVLAQMSISVASTADRLNVSSASPNSELKLSYDEVIVRLNKISELLSLYRKLLESGGISDPADTGGPGEIDELKDFQITSLSLNAQRGILFVGEQFFFQGDLTSSGQPLAGREVKILLENTEEAIAATDASGHFQGTATVPFRYTPQIEVRALYLPVDSDRGVYLGAVSPVSNLNIQYYEAELEVSADKVYPGIETSLEGAFDYAGSPAPSEREIEIFLDDALISKVQVQDTFLSGVLIPADTGPGLHRLSITAKADGRYAPVFAHIPVKASKAETFVEVHLPAISLIPGSLELTGNLYSNIGPLDDAVIEVDAAGSRASLRSSSEGIFSGQIKAGMGFGLMGTRQIALQVTPSEPWNAPLITTRSIFMINYVNTIGIIIILISLGIYLPRRFRVLLEALAARRPVLEPAGTTDAGYSTENLDSSANRIPHKPEEGSIIYWYSFVLKIIQSIANIFIRPDQTLREYSAEAQQKLGFAGRYFFELTKIVEKLLYSRGGTSEEDVLNSRQLSLKIQDEIRPGEQEP